MLEHFNASEFRLRQLRSNTSAANALVLDLGYPGPPDGKYWIVYAAGYQPSVAETKVIAWDKSNPAGGLFGIINPISMALNPAIATPIEQGMYIVLMPGQYLRVRRDSATAGSTMSGNLEMVEVDIPLYDYTEPQVAARLKRVATSMATRVMGAGGGGGGGSRGIVGARVPPARPK